MILTQFSLFNKLLLATALFPLHAFSNTYPGWWLNYEPCAWPSLDAAVPSDCSTATGLAATQCLCSSSAFLTSAAEGISSQCGCSILDQSAATAVSICQNFQFAIALNESQIIAAGSLCKNETTSSTPTSSSTIAASTSGSGGSGGLSVGLTAAVSVMSLVATIIGTVIGYMTYRHMKNKKNKTDNTAVTPTSQNPKVETKGNAQIVQVVERSMTSPV